MAVAKEQAQLLMLIATVIGQSRLIGHLDKAKALLWHAEKVGKASSHSSQQEGDLDRLLVIASKTNGMYGKRTKS
jgi:hypothetical protein